MAQTRWEAAYANGRADERERIRQVIEVKRNAAQEASQSMRWDPATRDRFAHRAEVYEEVLAHISAITDAGV